MIKTLLTVLALIAVVVVAATDLDNGRYSLVHLKAAQFAEHRFDLDLPRFHKNQVHIVAVPHGCDSPINIFASVDKLPTNTTFDFSSKTVNVQRTSWLAANLTQSGHTHGERINMLIQAPVNPGQACSVYFNAYASHTQALQVLENSVPQWGVFHIDAQHQHPHIHWFEFDLKKHGDDKVEGLGFYITSLNGDLKQEHYTFNAFVSGDNARPTPQNHQWASLSLDDGEAYVQITKKEPHFKHDGKYYIAVALAENPQPPSNAVARVMYTITPHIIRHNAQSRPILLLDGETQVGASTHVEHISYFSFYVDAGRVNEPVRLEVAMRTGSIRLFASSKTTNPSKINHEYTSEGKSIDMMFKEASFVYVAVYTVSGIESTYDLTYHRV